MSVDQVFQSWYKGDDANKADIAQEAFKSVKQHFEQSNSLSSDEKALLGKKSSLQDVEKAVNDAFAKYEAKSEASKTRKWLQKASESICHYGQVLDVFVQHHPEYVSLAWGLMKVMFISVVNHGETLKLLSKSLFEVAQRLPRIQHLSALYPTKNMKLAIESLYSCVMEFLLIAHSWCNESKFKHIYHSFTRPHELRYGDLLQRIETCTDNINELATVGSQTELRVMHNTQSSKLNEIILSLQTSEKTRQAQIDGLNCAISRLEISSRDHDRKLDLIMQWLEASGLTINDLLTTIENFHSIQTSAQLDTNQKLFSLQLSQALATFSQSLEDPKSLYKHHLFLRNRRASGRGAAVSTNEFWLSPKLARWSSCAHSSLAIIRGSFTTRWAIQDFAIDIIQAVTMMRIPAVWVLGSANKMTSNAMLSPVDLVRYLTYQALRIEGIITTEKQLSLRHSQLEEAKTSQDWLELFKLITQDLGGQVYIIIDLATVSSGLKGSGQANLIYQLNEMLEGLNDERPHKRNRTKVKIILLVYEYNWMSLIPREIYDRLVPVKISGTKGLQGRRMRTAVNTRILPRQRDSQSRTAYRYPYPKVLDAETKLIAAGVGWSLGDGIRIKYSSCPLCRLILRRFDQDFIASPSTDKFELFWSLGPARRRAFWTHKAQDDTWIGFGSGMETADHPNPNSSFFLEPWTGPLVDSSRILSWISSCEQLHRSKCAMPTHLPFAEAFPGLHVLRLIDVEHQCIVEREALEKYIALSYVWGFVSSFRLTKANRTAMLIPGSLEKVSKMLPNTIKDAIALAGRLGCRYLWVDALCLLQNDTDDLTSGVNVMDLVYERAWLTVAAACGHDANARLPGVQEGTRESSFNTFEVVPGVQLGIVTGLDGLLRQSVYHSRAWTFQEQVLSRRVLYFIDNKVFYRCRAAEHAEHFVDNLSQTAVESTSRSLLPSAVLINKPVSDLSMMLFYYTKRFLTNQNDTSRAMAGIIRRIAELMKCNFLQGLPSAMIDLFIIFYACDTILHRRATFPSYSWTGWRGSIDMDLETPGNSEVNDWLRDRTWIIWYKRNPSGITHLVWDPDANPSFPLSDMEYVGYRQRRPFSNGRYVPRQLDTRRTMPTEQVFFSREVPSYPMLQFWTLSLVYRIFDIDVFRATGYLQDSNNRKCGFVFLDGFEETDFFEPCGFFEIILLSETYRNKFANYTWVQWDDPYPLAAGQWKYYNIMILEWNGGIAERRGFGLLHQGAVKFSLAPGPYWKEIFLA
ncbi:uncharacterized protein FTJAE_12864 [Fusarium tjaetaba]|uniref:Heterokaryon incompatibility domain-containing protein n=1 Tax=Fusarium tjaetaba TaxID=1567544 RepID=A0A8H5QKC6_9HYPO|nr:uncharacterized protein FTJAE_12864 [Fusarium tjaetaba]KAF5616872.1 hypothetical protein FTJAE_12864 [Fusarium tjaetaba]